MTTHLDRPTWPEPDVYRLTPTRLKARPGKVVAVISRKEWGRWELKALAIAPEKLFGERRA